MKIGNETRKNVTVNVKSIYIILFLTSISLCSFFFITINTKHHVNAYVYDSPESRCLKNISYINKSLELETITFYYLNNSYSLDEFLEIIDLLLMNDIQILPPDLCTSCIIKQGLSWQRICMQYSCPLLLLFQDETLIAIIISRCDQITFKQAFNCSQNFVKVFVHDGSIATLNDNAKAQIESIFRNRRPVTNILQILIVIFVITGILMIGYFKLRVGNLSFQLNRNIHNVVNSACDYQ